MLDELSLYNRRLLIRVHTLVLVGLILFYYLVLMCLTSVVILLAFRSVPQHLLLTLTIDVLAVLFGLRIGIHVIRAAIALVTTRLEGPVDLAGQHVLPEEDHPRLFESVRSVAYQVRAKIPNEIRLSAHAECFVVELRKFSLVTKRKVILVLGLPHFEVLTVEEIKVVFAHELAHLANGDTRLAVFVFRFDRYLTTTVEKLRKNRLHLFDPIYWYAAAYRFVFLSLASPLYRILELRADDTSARVYGGKVAVKTVLKERMLSMLFENSVASHVEGTYGGGNTQRSFNLYREFNANWREFSLAGHDYLERRLVEEEERFSYSRWDSHPLIKQRILAMRRNSNLPTNRQETDSIPARVLLGDKIESIEDEMYAQIGDLARSRTAH